MTLAVPILESDWTQVNVESFGTVGNFGERDVHLRELTSKPPSSVTDGHILRPGKNSRFSLSNGNKLWARSIIADSKVLVSTDIDAALTNIEMSLLLGSFLRNLNDTNEQIITQLKLLNLRVEEAFDTTLSELDLKE